MRGLVPRIHVFAVADDVDGRHTRAFTPAF
jgi:hypothetical protein